MTPDKTIFPTKKYLHFLNFSMKMYAVGIHKKYLVVKKSKKKYVDVTAYMELCFRNTIIFSPSLDTTAIILS